MVTEGLGTEPPRDGLSSWDKTEMPLRSNVYSDGGWLVY